MNTKTKPLTGRIKDIVSRHLANRIHLDPVEIQGLLRFKKICPSTPIPEQIRSETTSGNPIQLPRK